MRNCEKSRKTSSPDAWQFQTMLPVLFLFQELAVIPHKDVKKELPELPWIIFIPSVSRYISLLKTVILFTTFKLANPVPLGRLRNRFCLFIKMGSRDKTSKKMYILSSSRKSLHIMTLSALKPPQHPFEGEGNGCCRMETTEGNLRIIEF